MSEDHRRRRRRRHRHHGIGELPDEILIHILSFLSLEEASVTASLSSRWRYLWAARSRLDFDISFHTRIERENGGIGYYPCDWIARNFEQQYVSWVNQLIAMRSRAAPAAVDEFSVGFCLNSKYVLDINRWVVFAFSNGAKRLKLDFNDAEGKPNPCVDKLYNFPVDILLRYDLCSNGLDSLQSLCLKSVNIEYDDALESLISRCPTLESIVLANVGCLGSLRLLCLSRSSRLKKLELSGCHHLQRVQIFDIPSLVSLKLNPVPKDCYFDKLPRLVELAVVGGGGGNMEPLKPFSSVCSELKTLEISGMDARNISYNNQMKAVFRLTMLEKLLITVNECNGMDLMPYTYLIQQAPNLQKLGIKVQYPGSATDNLEDADVVDVVLDHHRRSSSSNRSKHLKMFEFQGYYSRASDNAFIGYMMENYGAESLETIMINPSYCPIDDPFCKIGRPGIHGFNRLHSYQKGRLLAEMHFAGKVPPKARLVICRETNPVSDCI